MSDILNLGEQRRYHIYHKQTEMRKGFDSLCWIVRNELTQDVVNGDAFIFINRTRTHVKLLLWEGDAFTIVYRRLGKGAF